MLVALYGTLKVGHFNYELHLKGETPIRALFVELPYVMYANDEYPMLIPTENGERHRLWFEVFEVDDDKLRELDALEGRYDYWRETVFVEELEQSIGIYLHATPPPTGFVRVESGKWSG